jgi:DNA-binding response OmpR family regulator
VSLVTDRARPRTVLVVDDHAPTRLLCRVALEAEGWRVVEAADGQEALGRARAERPDVILLDVMMPGFSGWRVAADVAADPRTVDVPVVFITGLGGRTEHLRGLELGAVGYITKPFDPADLAPALGALLERIENGERAELLAEQLGALRAQAPTA